MKTRFAAFVLAILIIFPAFASVLPSAAAGVAPDGALFVNAKAGQSESANQGVYSLPLRYDDRYDVTGKEVVIVDAGTPTSYKVGYGVEDNTFDDAVIRIEDGKLIACGIGTALVVIDGVKYEITVTAAPISLLFLIGQSNMQGSEGDKTQSIICPEGQVYSTYGDRYTMTEDNARDFAPSALSGEYRDINVNGNTDFLSGYPVYSLTEPGEGKPGMDSGIAYEWVRATGEKVWVVNAAHGGTSVNLWQKNGKEYKESLLLFSACRDTLSKEIAAGHFTLSHMCYFWCQGCNDSSCTAEWYVSKYRALHENLKNDHAFDHDCDPSTPDVTFEFGGIIPILYGLNSYREGVYADPLTVPYYESFRQLTFNGPRVAHYYMCADPELPDVYMVCNIGEKWVWMPDGTNGVKEYFEANYENGTVDYVTQVEQKASWYKPTTPAAVHDSIHYNQIGYNEVGLVTARNALILLGMLPDTDAPTEVTFYNWTGYEEVTSAVASAAASPASLIVPVVTPCYRSKQVTYTVSDGLEYKYYDLISDRLTPGTLAAVGAEGSVAVKQRELASYTWVCASEGLVDSPVEGDTSNALVKIAGSFADGRFKDARYRVSDSVCLLHDQPWVIEIRVSDWTGSGGCMVFSGASDPTNCRPYLYLRPTDGFAGFGCYDGSKYLNYGVSLAEYGISLKDGAHTCKFVNSVSEDGSNAVRLFVDGVQISVLDKLFTNSTLTSSGVNWFDGRDMVMNFLGASGWALNGIKVEYIRVTETGEGGDIHVHVFTEWETVALPSAEGTGIDRRVCTLCGEAEEKYTDGVWQIYDISSHLAEMPENVCSGTDLWKVLEHRSDYFASGVKWGVHSSGQVCSVTIPVIPGERIYASSFESGSATANGIRTTFFDTYGVLKTYEPSQVYNEFVANGGYIVAPEGALYINIAMWSDSDEWEIYLLDRGHEWGEWVQTVAPTGSSEGEETRRCARCGETESRAVPKMEIIDIILFAGQSNMCGWAASTDAGFDTYTQTVSVDKAFTFNNAVGSDLLAITEPISANGTSRYGMVPSFLNAYYDTTGRRVCACFESHGGVNIDKFTKYKLDPATGEYTSTLNAYYTRMTSSVEKAKTSLVSLGFEVGNVYLVWCQGENEAYYLGTAVGTYTTEYQSTLTADWQKIEYYVTHFNDMLTCLKDDAGVEKAFIIRIGHRKNDTNKNSPIIKAQNIIGRTNADAAVVTTFLAGATAYKRDDGTVVNLMRDAPHYLPEGYYLAGSEAGRNAGLYVNSGFTLKPVLYEYDVNALSNAAEGEDPYVYDPYAVACRHTFVAEVTSPTCTETGYTTHTCVLCGEAYTDSFTDPLGHDFGCWEAETQPTCCAEGRDIRVCLTCGNTEYRDTRAAAKGAVLVSDRLPDGYFNGRSIVCIGDSITAGSGATAGVNDYVTVLGELLGADMIRLGLGGSVLCTGGHKPCNFDKLSKIPAGADIVTVYMGVNDWDHAIAGENGYYGLGEPDSTDPSTFRGALRRWCEEIARLKTLPGYENTKFVFCTPTITSWNVQVSNTKDWDQNKLNQCGFTLREYCEAILSVCAEYGIPVLDLNYYSGLYYNGPDDNNATTLYTDGIHPNPEGHAMIAAAIAEFLLDNYSYELVSQRCHQYGEWSLVIVPDGENDGAISRVCARCGREEIKELSYGVYAGDMDGSGVLDSEDAYRLLKYVLYPYRYEIKAFAPFYGGREPTSDDAVYLLRYILYPDKFPLIQSWT